MYDVEDFRNGVYAPTEANVSPGEELFPTGEIFEIVEFPYDLNDTEECAGTSWSVIQLTTGETGVIPSVLIDE